MADYVVVHVTNTHRYWTGTEWSLLVHEAKIYASYSIAVRVVWNELPAPKLGRLTTVPLEAIAEYRKRCPPLHDKDLAALRAIRECQFSLRDSLTDEERQLFDQLYDLIDRWNILP